jgi:O-antigen/teichoic acid export membrane protein
MVVADRFLIANILGAAVVAYYTIPMEFMIRLLVLPAAITTSLFPVFSKSFYEKKFTNTYFLYKKSIQIIFLIMGAIAVFVVICADYAIGAWLGPEFMDKSSSVVVILSIGILFNSMAQIPHAYIQASGDARSTAFIHIFESILYIPLLMLLLKIYGIYGAGLAWMLRALLDLILMYLMANRIFDYEKK